MPPLKIQSEHPFAPTINMKRANPGSPLWETLSADEKLAWNLRGMADAKDHAHSFSYTYNVHPSITEKDIWDAMCFGLVAAQTYLADLLRDREGIQDA